MLPIRYIFFGSTSDSVIGLEKLCQVSGVKCQAIVTQPPRPMGRKQILTPTPVDAWAKKHTIPVLSFSSDPEKPWRYADEQQVVDTLQPLKADLLISASYGVRIPIQAIQEATYGGLNVHPSLLPRWRGADPVPWAILSGDHQTGVTIVTLSQNFDQGQVIAQKKIPVTDKDTSGPLRTKLFTIGAELLIQSLPTYLTTKNESYSRVTGVGGPTRNKNNNQMYARKLTREDGFIPWETLLAAMQGNPFNPMTIPVFERSSSLLGHTTNTSQLIPRLWRALHPWPGIWTILKVNNKERRLKILRLSLIAYHLSLKVVQLEGKKPVSFDQFKTAYITHIPS